MLCFGPRFVGIRPYFENSGPFDEGELPKNFSDQESTVEFDFGVLVADSEVRNGFYLMVDTHNDWVKMHKRIVSQPEKADRLLSAK